MKYWKVMNFLDNTHHEPSKFRTRNWVEINDKSQWSFKASNQIKFKTSMIRSNLYDYSDAYILASGAMTINGTVDIYTTKQADERNKGVIFKKCAPFTDCISEINHAQLDNIKDANVVLPK